MDAWIIKWPWLRRTLCLVLCMASVALLFFLAMAYLDPVLRKAIIFSGLGMC